MKEGAPQLKSVSADEARSFTPEEIESAQKGLEEAIEVPSRVETPVSGEPNLAETERIEEVRERLAATAAEKIAPPAPEMKEAPAVSKEAVQPSPEQIRQMEADKLFASLDIPHDKDIYNRKQLLEERNGGESQGRTILSGLNGERHHNGEKQKKFFKGSMLVGALGITGGALTGIAGLATGATVLGYSGATLAATALAAGTLGIAAPAMAVGAVGWAGLKLYHGLKQRKHRKQFNKLYGGGRDLLSGYEAFYSLGR